MNDADSMLIGQMDDALAVLWYQMSQIGNTCLQREIEEVAERFMFPGDTPAGAQDMERAHDLFRRVHAEYTPEIQRRTGQRLVLCPHCAGEEEGNDHNQA